MFENLLVSASVQPHRRLSAPMLAAALAHGSAVSLLIVTPLLFPAVLRNNIDDLVAILRPTTSLAQPPPPRFGQPESGPRPPASPPQPVNLKPGTWYSPGEILDQIPPEVDPAEIAALWSGPSNGPSFSGTLPVGISLNAGFGVDPNARPTVGDPPEPPPAPVRETAPEKPVPVPPTVLRSRLVFQAAPDYPLIAKAAGVQGEVTLQVLVDETGQVAEVTVLGGHALLVEAARQAVARWRYSPTLLNGRPVLVTGLVIVRFKLSR